MHIVKPYALTHVVCNYWYGGIYVFSNAILSPTQKVPLGIVPHNETRNEEMIKIIQTIHRYVPSAPQGTSNELVQVAFGGDQLTAARARQAITSCVNSCQ